MHTRIARLTLMALLVAIARPAASQELRGLVRDSALSAPLPGVVVTALDSAGKAKARAISGAGGRFTLTMSTGTARLRAVRIGYRPRDIALPVRSTAPLEFAMTRIPALLEAVRVSDRELCPGSSDRGAAFQLWEQARAGLLAEVVARDANPATATTLVFERRMFLGDDLVQRQRDEQHIGRTTRPFVASATPARFAEHGYMVDVGADRLFSAPDADVLLDESFAATHCFHLEGADPAHADPAHADQAGLAFTPVPGRPDSLVDVQGVIWLSRTTPEIRSLEFQYTNLEPAATRAGVGGRIEFRTATNGVSFIERWSLRLPIFGVAPRRPLMVVTEPGVRQARSRRMDRTDVEVREIQEAGGQVVRIAWPDGTSWSGATTAIAGTVTERGTTRAVANALITLAGTPDTTRTNDRGEFKLAPIIPGRYSVTVIDTTLEAYTAPRSESRVLDVRDGQTSAVDVSFAPALDVIARLCRDQKDAPNTTTLVGRIALPLGTVPRDAEVRATWQDYAGHIGDNVSIATEQRTSTLDDGGRFLVCHVALDRPVSLTLLHGSAITADTILTPRASGYVPVDWRPILRRDK
jgi:hypothetical protein